MNNFIQTFGADKNMLIPLSIQDTTNGTDGTFQFVSGIQDTVAHNITPNAPTETTKQPIICPHDISQEQIAGKLASKFKGDMHTAFGIHFTSWSRPDNSGPW